MHLVSETPVVLAEAWNRHTCMTHNLHYLVQGDNKYIFMASRFNHRTIPNASLPNMLNTQGLSTSNASKAPAVSSYDGPDGLPSTPLGSGENLLQYQKRVDQLKKWFVTLECPTIYQELNHLSTKTLWMNSSVAYITTIRVYWIRRLSFIQVDIMAETCLMQVQGGQNVPDG